MFGSLMIKDQMERGRIKIEGSPPLLPGESPYLQPISYELTLGAEMEVGYGVGTSIVTYWLKPGEFILGHVNEVVTLSPEIYAKLDGKSTLARRGLDIHSTAGLIDPGFSGQITLELFNKSQHDIPLVPGMRIGQLRFGAAIGGVEIPYGDERLGSHYQHQRGATPAR